MFTPKKTDYELSPYTGLTRDSWVEAGKYLLSALFDQLKDVGSPMVLKRAEYSITYPHMDSEPGVLEAERRAEIFEGLARSFFIGSVLIAEEPELVLNEILVREYYRLHIIRSCTDKDSLEYAGTYEDMQALSDHTDPFKPFQQTVETCALVVGLWESREVLWDRLSKEERDGIAGFLSGYAHANTVPQNWRLFNMLDLAFLNMNGYEIDKDIMLDHARAILSYYAGDGWYRDGQSFDYYSCWAFNTYAPLWNSWYGYENCPEIAERFEEYSNKLMENYPCFFDRDGYTNMWGRSAIYRFAAISPFEGNMFLKKGMPKEKMGFIRRIASGSLLQFLGREDFLLNGVPSLGFYGQFTPLLQRYSCAASPLWLGKAFLFLHFDKEHPFWSEKEYNGFWEGLGPGQVKETVLEGPGLVATDHEANGEAILRSAKVIKNPEDEEGIWNYLKLCYNTKYPWESTPVAFLKDGAETRAESQQYVLRSLFDGHCEKANVSFYAGHRDGVLYRRQLFCFDMSTEWHWLNSADLADFPVPFGIFRADRLHIVKRPMEITLGAYGFPANGKITEEIYSAFSINGKQYNSGLSIKEMDEQGNPSKWLMPSVGESINEFISEVEIRRLEKDGSKAVVLKGTDSLGRKRQLAMTVFSGWKELEICLSRGTNPDTEYSVLLYAKGTMLRQYDGSEPYIFISQVITRDDGKDFSEDELFPVRQIDIDKCSKIRILFRNGDERMMDFTGIEGRQEL